MNNEDQKPKSNRGGARRGAGRKAASEEMKTRDLARAAIVKKYGSMEDGFIKLLESPDASLQKFVFEHAAGKPTDKIDLTSRIEETRVIDIDDNGDEVEDFEDEEYDENAVE